MSGAEVTQVAVENTSPAALQPERYRSGDGGSAIHIDGRSFRKDVPRAP